MSPLQLFLLSHCESVPGGSIELVELLDAYYLSLTGDEPEQWQSRAHVIDVLSRSFRIDRGRQNRRFVFGLTYRETATPALMGAVCHV